MFSLTNTLLQDTFSVCTTGGSDAPKHMDDATSTPMPYCTDKYLSLKKYLFDFCMIFSPWSQQPQHCLSVTGGRFKAKL